MSRARDFADLGGSADAGGITGRNMVINGAMTVAQRGTASAASGYGCVDRWKNQFSGGGVTQSQEDLSSSDTPYSYGFRKTLKLLNTSNSTATSAFAQIVQVIEAQNVACSGWDYTTSSSHITVQFWVKSSLAGTYYGSLLTSDGTDKSYSFEFTLVADTWKKVTHTFPGDSSITINNDNGNGLQLFIVPHYGTDFTTSGHTDEAWQTYSNADITGDYAQNWRNSSNATFFVTGVQFEVGETATPFEHRSFGDELARCQRYYQKSTEVGTAVNTATTVGAIIFRCVGTGWVGFSYLHTAMRDTPTATVYSTRTGASGKAGNLSAATDVTASAGPSENSIYITATMSNAHLGAANWELDAEL